MINYQNGQPYYIDLDTIHNSHSVIGVVGNVLLILLSLYFIYKIKNIC